MRNFPATQSYLVGNDLKLIAKVWEFFMDPEIGGSVPMVSTIPGMGYIISSQFGHCPMDSGVTVYFWTEGPEYCTLCTEDPAWNWDISEEDNLKARKGQKFATLEELHLYITTGES